MLERFAKEGFEIAGCKMISLTDDLLKEHYAHLADLPFFPEIRNFMSSRPVITVILKGDNVIARVRDILGPTDSATAPKDTLRGQYGTDKMRNVAHASDGPDTAAAEVKRFFKDEEVYG